MMFGIRLDVNNAVLCDSRVSELMPLLALLLVKNVIHLALCCRYIKIA